MFFPLAGLRVLLLPLLCLPLLSYAKENSLFTSSVTYCDPPEAVLIQYFDVAFLPNNNSVFFNISAESIEDDLNVSASILLNVYGMSPVNITIDLCSILSGVLCPLPKYHFKGSQTLQLPSTVDTSIVPGIAYFVPDLEGFAQLMLIDAKTGDLKACVQATLSNGKSMRQAAVSWGTGAVAFVLLLLAIWQSRAPYAILPVRLLDLMHLYQTIAASAFLSLNYPSAYRAFALNFSWTMGFISGSSEQASINHMRALTGSVLANSSSSPAVEQINRKLSPYNVKPSVGLKSLASIGNSFLSKFATSNFAAADSVFGGSDTPALSPSESSVQTVTADGSNVLQAGIPIYTNSKNIGTANAFMTVFFAMLVLAALYLLVVATGFAVSAYRTRASSRQRAVLEKMSSSYGSFHSFITSWALRLLMIVSFPIFIFTMFQWTLKDSWLAVLLSVITFLGVLVGIVFPGYVIGRSVRQSSPEGLHSDNDLLSKFSPIYGQYHPSRFYFGAISMPSFFLKALFISAAQGHGAVQIALFLVVEVASLALVLILKPTPTRGGDVFISSLAVIRVVCMGLMIAFLQSLAVSAIIRTAIGIVIALIFSVSVLLILGNIIVHLVQWIRQGHPVDPTPSPLSDDFEKGQPSSTSSTHSRHTSHSITQNDRPVNPTPDQHVILDPEVNRPYPVESPSTTGTKSTEGSSWTTLGSLMPSRWSFSFSPTRSTTSTRPSPQSDTFTTTQPHSDNQNPRL